MFQTDEKLTTRQRNLLFALIKEYCETGQTISSKELKEKYQFVFSPATIRNEFCRLRDLGYLFQPFTNSSSQPTEKAFKLFITQLINGLQVTNQRQEEIKKQLLEMQQKQQNLTKEISRLLALQAGGVGFSVDNQRENIAGLNNLLTSSSDGKVSDILDFLENLESHKKQLLDNNFKNQAQKNNSVKAYFGSDNPIIPLGKGYAMLAAEVLIDQQKNVIGLIVPTHLLAKKKNLELVETISKLLDKPKKPKIS
jgi:transcriptional regulator of heat shock response